ncbi:MAG: protein-L-isoaspartate(D-aspartate) O-methyltransferase [Phycisphaerae bacterium]|nr:protein-L-isoaspartate(D-aspartate) O-methyltransferase [Phycisphaerae bacterium]
MSSGPSEFDSPSESDRLALQRRRMVDEQVRRRGISDPRVLAAMEEIPRERFLPADVAREAFADAAVHIGWEQTISQPYMVAAMTAQLGPQPYHRVLEIGTGSGYQTAILARLAGAGRVYTIERLPMLQEAARVLLTSLGFSNVEYRVGDGCVGWPEAAPFNRIMVTAGAPAVPQALVDQLADGGRLIVPVGGADEQILTTVERRGERTIEIPGMRCRFVKLIGQGGW